MAQCGKCGNGWAPAAGGARGAFSLIEMLVVIAILATLAGILLPTIGLVRGQAKSMACLSRLVQMQMANMVYASDMHGVMVPCYHVDGGGGWTDPWVSNTLFLADISDGKVNNGSAAELQKGLLCPLAEAHMANPWYQPLMLSTGYNTQYPHWPPAPNSFVGPKVLDGRQADLIAFTDALDWTLTNYYQISQAYWVSGVPVAEGIYVQGAVAFRHHGKANAVFCDGHAATLAYAEMNSLRAWNP